MVYLSKDGINYKSVTIGEKNNFHATIKANIWFAMKTVGKYSLIGCSVAPAFDYSDFELAPKEWKPKKFDHPL